MARPVAISQRTGEPTWFIDGKRALTRKQGFEEEAHAAVQGVAANARAIQRFARAAAFLRDNYPKHFSGEVLLRAGSAAVLELIKIRDLSADTADAIADRCLAGEVSVADLRALTAKLHAAAPAADRTGRNSSSRWLTSFEIRAIERIRDERLLPEPDRIASIARRDPRSALEPDFIVHYSPDRWVAVDVKAPRDSAARSVTHVAAGLVSRVAALRLRYDDVILVLPEEAQAIAQAAVNLWASWAISPSARSARLRLLVLGETRHHWLESS